MHRKLVITQFAFPNAFFIFYKLSAIIHVLVLQSCLRYKDFVVQKRDEVLRSCESVLCTQTALT